MLLEFYIFHTEIQQLATIETLKCSYANNMRQIFLQLGLRLSGAFPFDVSQY